MSGVTQMSSLTFLHYGGAVILEDNMEADSQGEKNTGALSDQIRERCKMWDK